ncbi:MAG: type II toxin-antitoxin system VapC family toxin [Spirochaetia bacterium]|nr:type II toxin-antitoxin system VapC family toxin [Spirochaetia bacterium]
MILCDVNILVYAHRADLPEHNKCKKWFLKMLNSKKNFAVSDYLFSSFLRIITHPKIFQKTSPFDKGVEFINLLKTHPNAVQIIPEDKQWEIFLELCEKTRAGGNLIADAYIAALALASNCALATADKDFKRFSDLKIINPLDA